jgi:transcriptional regulator with XRE-family HTH domain
MNSANIESNPMEQVLSLWEQKKAEGWTQQQLGEAMGYGPKSARKSVSQFLKSKRPQLAMIQKFMDAVGVSSFTPNQPTVDPMNAPIADEKKPKKLPYDPIFAVQGHMHARRNIVGVLESYNSSYDAIAEAVQNSMDALEDAALSGLPGPYQLEVTVDLKANALTVLDTGIGMTQDQVCEAFAPTATFKDPASSPTIFAKRGRKNSYRGYKGVGLTYLAYGTDEIWIQSVRDGELVKGRMRHGRRWAEGQTDTPPIVDIDDTSLGLDRHKRGTAVRIVFSGSTRPAHLSNLGTSIGVWEAILRTRTAAGQVLLGREPVAPIKIKLTLINNKNQRDSRDIEPLFYYPDSVKKNPEFRFLDVWDYHQQHQGVADIPATAKRQDGIYLRWTTEELRKQLGESEASCRDLIEAHGPELYAFRPYQSSVYTELNLAATDQEKTKFFDDGLVLAVDRQRLADVTAIKATKWAYLAEQTFVLVHFEKAKPDRGRKTLQSEFMQVAQSAANAAIRYLADQNSFLKQAGEKSTSAQRQVELDHDDWVYNVKTHARSKPMALSPIAYASEPLTEQDVVGLFHQLCAIGLFPGIKIFATSSQHTYDCYVQFECKDNLGRLRYKSIKDNPLGLSSDVFGPEEAKFHTPGLTLEFKNSLEGLISDLENPSKSKTFPAVDILVCWSAIGEKHRHYELTPIDESNLETRRYPGVTHTLRKDGETSHTIQVIMLEHIVQHIATGHIKLPGK